MAEHTTPTADELAATLATLTGQVVAVRTTADDPRDAAELFVLAGHRRFTDMSGGGGIAHFRSTIPGFEGATFDAFFRGLAEVRPATDAELVAAGLGF